MRRYFSSCCFLLCLVVIILTFSVASSRTIEDILKLPEEETDLAEAFLCLAQDLWQDVFGETFDVASYLKHIDEMALSLRKRIDKSDNLEAIVASINEYLFGELGFKEISEGFEDLFLNSVIEKKGGNCVGLSILYLSLGERLGLPLYGVTMPGHFFVRYDDGQKKFNIETTLAGMLLPDEFYLKRFQTFLGNPLHFKNLTKKETIGAILLDRGAAYKEKGFYKKAIADYTKAIELNPKDADTYYNRGGVYYGQGLYGKAIADYTKAIELNPEFAEAYYSLALTYERINRPEEALKAYEMFVRLASPGYKRYIGYILERIKSLKERLFRKDK